MLLLVKSRTNSGRIHMTMTDSYKLNDHCGLGLPLAPNVALILQLSSLWSSHRDDQTIQDVCEPYITIISQRLPLCSLIPILHYIKFFRAPHIVMIKLP